MGGMKAADLAELIATGELTKMQALKLHLRSNHYPPAGLEWMLPCKVALDKAFEAYSRTDRKEAFDELVNIPNGGTATVEEVIDTFHLEHFISIWEAETDGSA